MATAAAIAAGDSTPSLSSFFSPSLVPKADLDAARTLVAKDNAKKRAVDNARLVLQQDDARKIDDLCRWRENKVPREVLCVGCRKERGTPRSDGSRRCTRCEVTHAAGVKSGTDFAPSNEEVVVALVLSMLFALLFASDAGGGRCEKRNTCNFDYIGIGFILFMDICMCVRIAYVEGYKAAKKENLRIVAITEARGTLDGIFERELATPREYHTPPSTSSSKSLSVSDMN